MDWKASVGDWISSVNWIESFLRASSEDPQIEAAIKNYETAFQMQNAVSELSEISHESKETRHLHGLDSPDAAMTAYARRCLLARRLVQNGVRFIELR